jgi:plastocyanin
MRSAVSIVAVALIAAIAAGCGGRGAEQPQQPAAQPPAQPAQPVQPAGPGEVVRVEGGDNYFEPATITITAGREYEIVFANVGTAVHNMIIQSRDAAGQDFASDIVVNANQENRFKVRIDREGTYKIICTYHPEMVGELKVTR